MLPFYFSSAHHRYTKMRVGLIIFVVVVLLLRNSKAQDQVDDLDNELCMNRTHYNDESTTCCAFVAYRPPPFNPFVNNDALQNCLAKEEIKTAEKLVPRSWRIYECLVEANLNNEKPTLDKFVDFMISRYPEDVRTAIKNKVKEIQQSKPKKAKRSLRIRREEGDVGGTPAVTEAQNSPITTENNELGATTQSGDSSTGPAQENAAELDTTTGPPDSTAVGEAGDTTPEAQTDTGESSSEEVGASPSGEGSTDAQTESDNPSTIAEAAEDTTQTFATYPPYPIHSYLSAYEYFDNFKDAIPNEEIFEMWDTYYSAEMQACHLLGKSSEEVIKSYGAEKCLGWLMRTSRRGECCNAAPVPMPLLPARPLNAEKVVNFTVEVLNITGGYTFTNLTYSSNIYRCTRLAIAILQKQISLDDIKQEIEIYIEKNMTTSVNYKKIADILIPSYFHPTLRDTMKTMMLPPTTQRPDESTNYYVSMDYDPDLKKFADMKSSVYQWASASEWDSKSLEVNGNRTRYLMWTCDAYRLVSQRIKYFDATDFCY